MCSLQQRDSGFNVIITSLAREKLRGKYCMQKSPHELFLIVGCKGLINEVEFFFVFFTLCPSDLLRREEVWRTKIKALATNDLNVQE